jgi:5-methylcytosine-specific restriction endonuclease McrA
MPRLKTLAPRLKALDTRRLTPPPKRAEPFYLSPAWRWLVARLIRERGRRCERCGRTGNADGSWLRLFGDHVVELKDGGAELDPGNVRLLCGSCHSTKTAKARADRMARPLRAPSNPLGDGGFLPKRRGHV